MKTTIASFIVVTALLTACGGGGGGGSQPAQPTTPAGPTQPAQPSSSVSLITTPVTPPASTDNEAVAALNYLSAERDRCGFGKLNWSAPLAVAAIGHADWQLVNNYLSHRQVTGTPGFTGVTFEDRYIAAGYASAGQFAGTDEISSLIGTNTKTGEGAQSTRQLIAAPFHGIGLFSSYTDAGVAVRNATDVGSTHGPRVAIQINLGYKFNTGPQLPSSSVIVRTYLCQGSTGSFYQVDNETPNPVPGRNLATNPIGAGILIDTPVLNGVLTITSASVTAPGNVNVPLLPTLTYASDTNGIIQPHQAVLIPDNALMPATTYSVSIAGNVNGTVFTRNFTYTTGN
jgi:uncharacterized protein YkwD